MLHGVSWGRVRDTKARAGDGTRGPFASCTSCRLRRVQTSSCGHARGTTAVGRQSLERVMSAITSGRTLRFHPSPGTSVLISTQPLCSFALPSRVLCAAVAIALGAGVWHLSRQPSARTAAPATEAPASKPYRRHHLVRRSEAFVMLRASSHAALSTRSDRVRSTGELPPG
jgi:hypothetical protein